MRVRPLSTTGRRAVKSFFISVALTVLYLCMFSLCAAPYAEIFIYLFGRCLHYVLLLLTCFPSYEGPFHVISHAVTGAVESQDP